MDNAASLRQTVTHLFDAVRHSEHAKELQETSKRVDAELDEGLARLDGRTEELSDILASLESDQRESLKEFSRQVSGFLEAAKQQARAKLIAEAKEKTRSVLATVEAEKDKAKKSLEDYLGSGPLPIIESTVSVSMADGMYHAKSSFEAEGGIKYEFGLATQNSALLSQEFSLSRLGMEVKIPVRFTKTVLKGRVPGFERLDQYTLLDAETTGNRIRANFEKGGDGARIKIVASGVDDGGFLGIDYSDNVSAVNVLADPSLSAQVDIEAIRKAMSGLMKALLELSEKKVTLLSLSLRGEDQIKDLDCSKVLDAVLGVLGTGYKTLVQTLPVEAKAQNSGELSLKFIQGRLRILGAVGSRFSAATGIPLRA